MNKNSNNGPSLEILAARFAYAGAAITTLGDMLATISAGITLRLLEEEASSKSSTSNSNLFPFEVEQMQLQMDELIREMKHLKKMMN